MAPRSLHRLTAACLAAAAALAVAARPANAADLLVGRGADLQAALDAAAPGDTLLLEPGATFVGNFRLPAHGGNRYITVRSAASDALLPPSGTRIGPGDSPNLPHITSPNNLPALRTAPGAAFWRLLFLEIGPSANPIGTALELGDGSAAQSALPLVAHHLIVDRVYIHGDPQDGLKRAIALNSATTTIVNSYVAEVKAVAQDAQALAGWNGPGPYHIENNYFEGAGTTVLFGGDDPRIEGLVPSDIVFRHNVVTRPAAWRSPILAAPAQVVAAASPGGTLAAGTYAYRVVARRAAGSAMVRSAVSAEAAVTVPAASGVRVQWPAVPEATDYLVYGRTPGGQTRCWRVSSTSFVDDGTNGGNAGTPSGSPTVWQVKNLFELKNARRVQVDHNVIENNWVQAQSGTAILFTPRNQYGRCTWCVVEDVTFEHNVLRSIAGGIQVLGRDDLNPSGVASAIRIRHNLVYDLSKAWGGSAYFLYVTGGPHDLIVDHNTIVSPNGSGIVMFDGVAATGFVFTNNLARHNAYGLFGSGVGYGTAAMTRYFPDGTLARNVLAGGRASNYPAGNFFPTTSVFEAHFVDYAAGDYALRPGTDWSAAATDGLDLGADLGALAGSGRGSRIDLPSVDTMMLPPATAGEAYETALAGSGGSQPYVWGTCADSALPAGLQIDPLTGRLAGAPAADGDAAFCVELIDATGTAAARALTLHVERPIPPVSLLTTFLPSGTVAVPYSAVLEAAGGQGPRVWSVSGGMLPPGLSLSPDGVIAGVATAAGSADVEVTVKDSLATARRDTRAFTLTILPPPNRAPSVTLTSSASGSTVPVGATLVLAAHPLDVDGTIARVDVHAGTTLIGTAVAPDYSITWQVPSPGVYSFTATAVDDDAASTISEALTLTTTSEIVLYAADAEIHGDAYTLVDDESAAGGRALWNPNRGEAKVSVPAADPASYAELTFYAEQGRPYHLWIRGRAERNHWANDSVLVQFSNTAADTIGTTDATWVGIEDGTNAGLSGWGWQDNGYAVLGAPVVFTSTGRQTIRLQPREDGLTIDQIVLSPDAYVSAAPGATKDDATILAR